MAFFTYFTPPPADRSGVDDSSGAMSSSGGHQDMLQAAGFRDIVEIDVTDQFLSTAKAWHNWRERYAAELISAEGEPSFRGRQSTYLDHVNTVQAGGRSRCLFLARRS